jgi:hypothetical protein
VNRQARDKIRENGIRFGNECSVADGIVLKDISQVSCSMPKEPTARLRGRTLGDEKNFGMIPCSDMGRFGRRI